MKSTKEIGSIGLMDECLVLPSLSIDATLVF